MLRGLGRLVGGGLLAFTRGLAAKKGKKKTTTRLVSQAGTGYFYTIRRATGKHKLELMKYDPRVNAHVLFKEEKIRK